MRPDELAIEILVPHAGNMVLVSQLLSASDDEAKALVKVKNDGLFSGDQRKVPAWIGIEYMAQTIAAWAGYQAHQNNEPVKLGFLLGTRRYTSNVANFTVGDELTVSIKEIFQGDNGLAAFDCIITDSANVDTLLEASLNVFQSDELSQLAKG